MIIGTSTIQDFMKGAISTVNGANGSYDPNGNATGLLSPEEVEGFSKMVMDSNEFLKEVDIQLKSRVSGNIEELGVAKRLLRKKIEDTDNITGNEVKPIINKYGYRTVGMTLGTEISNDWYRQNRAKEDFEQQFMGIISEQVGNDILDLGLNGDEDIDDAEEDSQFLNINDGWLKLLLDKIPPSQLVDGKTLNNGFFTDQYFYELKKKLPTKYFKQGTYKWICSSNTQVKVLEYLRSRQTAAGDAAIVGGMTLNPLMIPFSTPTGFPDDIIIFGDPKRLKVVWTYDVGMRKTTEGKELVAKDNRFYAWFFDNDYVVVNPGAFTMLINVGEVLEYYGRDENAVNPVVNPSPNKPQKSNK